MLLYAFNFCLTFHLLEVFSSSQFQKSKKKKKKEKKFFFKREKISFNLLKDIFYVMLCYVMLCYGITFVLRTYKNKNTNVLLTYKNKNTSV